MQSMVVKGDAEGDGSVRWRRRWCVTL